MGCGQAAALGVPMIFHSARLGPDPAMRTSALRAIRELAEMEVRARDYLASVTTNKPLPGLRLAAVQILRPVAEWVRREIAPENPTASDAILSGAPVVSLEFEIAGERDAADVIFFNGVPVGWDYH